MDTEEPSVGSLFYTGYGFSTIAQSHGIIIHHSVIHYYRYRQGHPSFPDRIEGRANKHHAHVTYRIHSIMQMTYRIHHAMDLRCDRHSSDILSIWYAPPQIDRPAPALSIYLGRRATIYSRRDIYIRDIYIPAGPVYRDIEGRYRDRAIYIDIQIYIYISIQIQIYIESILLALYRLGHRYGDSAETLYISQSYIVIGAPLYRTLSSLDIYLYGAPYLYISGDIYQSHVLCIMGGPIYISLSKRPLIHRPLGII